MSDAKQTASQREDVVNERAVFRLLYLGCCERQLLWINPHLPKYCPECGKLIYPQVRNWVSYYDERARIEVRRDGMADTLSKKFKIAQLGLPQ